MEDFRFKLHDEIHLLMSRGDICWTLESNINFVLWLDGSSFIVCEAEDISIIQPHLIPVTTPDPEPSQPWPRSTDMMPDPTNDGARELASMSIPEKKTEPTLQPNPQKMSDHVCEPATSCFAVGLLVEF